MHNFILVFVLLFSLSALQTRAQSNSSFVSAADQDLNLRSITVVPFTDNIKGIYAIPLYKKFIRIVSQDKQWSYQALPDTTPTAPLDLDENPQAVKALMDAAKTDGLFSFRITKGPKGLNGKLTFFSGKEGFPLIQEELRDYPGFEIADLEKEIESLYFKIKARIPFRGVILSRRGQEVTINLGYKDGLKNNDELSIVQILKVNRHPKLKFMIGTDKEIIGKLKIFKTDEYLSFGYITYEREAGVVKPLAKLLPQAFVEYNTPVLQGGKLIPGLQDRNDRELSYGENPREWLPLQAPQFGRLSLLAGLGNYSHSANLSASGAVDASTNLAPEVMIKGELWMSSEWNILFNLRQSVFSLSNPQTNSTPGNLDMALSSYSVLGAYNFLMSDDFFGPKIQLSAGYASYASSNTKSSPQTFSDLKYSGLVVGLAGLFPLTTEVPIDLGAQMYLFLNPGTSESPSTSSSVKSNINQFGFFGVYHVRSRFKIRAEVNFEYYSTDFSGAAVNATNSTQKMTSLLGGIEYLF